MSRRQITIKPTCARELMAFPADRSAVLWEKINWLIGDPFPDGRSKKKLQVGNGVCRLRVGDHRVFYRYGDDWVCLLGIRRRREDTYRAVPQGDPTPALPELADDDLDVLDGPATPTRFDFEPATHERPLPFPFTNVWLEAHDVPRSTWQALRHCRTEEDLLEIDIDADVQARVIDAVFPPTLEVVEQQPDLVVSSTEDLVRYKEGDLLGFLLRLDGAQLKLTRWAMRGPTMVRGGAGTGKSTVALYRVKEVLSRDGAGDHETVLFTTYTRALLAATRQLLEQLLPSAQMRRVRVATVDQIAREIVAQRRNLRVIESDGDALRRVRTLRSTFIPAGRSAFDSKLRARALARLSDRYILEEFDWIIDGRGLDSLQAYKAAPRPGRGVPFSASLRESVWTLHELFIEQAPAERFSWLRNEALESAQAGDWSQRWDHVFVDEAQDLSPAALALMAEVVAEPGGLFFAADSKQSLYSRNYTWSAVHPRLQFRGRTAVLRRNYRSTKEIDRAAFAVLHAEAGETLEGSTCVHKGPLPILLRGVPIASEADWIARFVRQMSRHLRLRCSAAAVLVPSGAVGQELAERLSEADLSARYFKGRELDLSADVVKVLTLYSAKGLEFPIVVAAGLHDGTYPAVDDFDDKELFGERMRHHRRLLYVGLTRAMRGLMLVVPRHCQNEALRQLDTRDWHVEDVR